MFVHNLPILLLAATAFCTPTPTIPEQNIERRQQDIPQLLTLASLAGITALPTDPAVLLRLGPLANQLASALPTSPVLSVLETAAPRSFISNIVHDPAYASSFESAFAAGSSPSWFTALPTSVKSYLHTYTGFAGIATAAAELDSATRNASAAATATGPGLSKTGSTTGSGRSVSTSSTGSTSVTAAGGTTQSSSVSQGGAAKPTGMIAAGMAGVVGFLGVAAVL